MAFFNMQWPGRIYMLLPQHAKHDSPTRHWLVHSLPNSGHSSHVAVCPETIRAEPTARVAPMLETDLCLGNEAYTHLSKLLLDKLHSAKFIMCSSCVLPAVSNT